MGLSFAENISHAPGLSFRENCDSPKLHPILASRRNTFITMMKATEFGDFNDRSRLHYLAFDRALFSERQMWTRPMVLVEICGQGLL
jgi:hypothetical protein